ncbi:MULTISPECIES: flagellar basal body rod protein FlgB [Methylobacterium]|uniref:Flagellar basal body rod protein FlgB n=3 Tax=Methylobacterium TaxID=407 RepID=A0AAE8HTI3_9HYPH|nr:MULTISPECIES: flagellar basal body rod protein FlgB [Methylobacterium]KOX43524.1 flagellar basal body rod protein FlgB [Streptomyces purpurogeneiscleroticus]AIQ90406.1 Flagellar basal-body rod protein FlgB [Methylobacterium oryzae CBMB20]APT31136.1 motility and Chemotaxis [Methylobacterium phyllosphaerae]AWV17432.1 flagellar basal body rod protein FlgB [Methylobacterium sp. XJLW]MBA9065896.1 flagellar basal-body rod protein FlgB [Methylobacterium fujisawaense]
MALTDLPVLSMLRTRMQWAQARQGVIAENVANADMPGFKPRDLVEPRFDRATGTLAATATGLTLTSPGHMAPAGQTVGADSKRAKGFEVRPSGNGVNLEDEMMKAGENQSDYQLAASLYQHSLTTLKIAIGKS